MKKTILGLAMVCLSAVPLAAQMISNPAQWYINNQIYSTRVFNGVVANSMLRKGGKTGPRKSVPAKDFTAFKATPSSLPKTLAGKSSNRAETEKLLETFVTLYKQTAAKDGFPSNDLAYAFEYFVVNNYQIYHDLVDVPADKDPRGRRAIDGFDKIRILSEKKLLQVTIAQERKIYQQFREVLAANVDIQKMTDGEKQEAAEMLAILFGVNFAGYLKGIGDGDEALTDQARELAKGGLEKLLGVSVSQIKITNYGLEL